MLVTVPLPSRRGATRSRRHRAATRAVAVSAVAISALTALNAADDLPAQAQAPIAPLAFTPREAQMPQTVPEAVLATQRRIADEAARIAAELARPHTVRPVAGVLTSTFGMRWGALHAGIDFGDPIGTPIEAVTDGVVIDAGPADGFGLWVRVQQDDGTIGIYGHVNEIIATVGQHVRAGDVIATVGNRGYSTGPHLHYEIHSAAGEPIDPLPWLAARGIVVSGDPS
ncbi:M23 family metallopeptidase [Nocardia arthritidis]|uniref:Peptidoglycan DD-metalloendopeptidase family protein n=1 Tax=Nocardia arthritidis TaxID=228602 RepID=A0A6G9YIQ9_9NOCA|nr:M23 family metallopeptidase [Nocardia arthritidis]QIS13081.1 peptidoglycan DD-metalloendopeptidase family protein [Nocardia arthritidis]